MKTTFVVLHYITIVDTRECVRSLIDNVEGDFDIVVVDNGSNDGSGIDLEFEFKDYQNIHIIISEKNLGFASGNNLGYQFAKHELKSDFIVLINNDTLVNQKNFIKVINNKYTEHKFHILGPDILSLSDNKHQNPHFSQTKRYSKRGMVGLIVKYTISHLLIWLKLDDILRSMKDKLLLNRSRNKRYKAMHTEEHKNVMLHGCCLIFSKEYIQKYNGLYDKTFLYMEEDILFYIARKEKLLTMYSPDILIYHKEDSSTNAIVKAGRQKRLFIYKHHRKSAIEFLKILFNDNVYRSRMINL
ncbi:hypothetical protein PAT3040_02710 [Paenibacillus agaridevorans]|uniref:Glycosyltransferase 2-like domain-containing protein n=2 Tax=Paenibacillus agaridevorans TaxID=171404 RepID=A0A2R5ENB9_9BACL|nr:hypothetical protein PAT3040_02710 [Paenibacillus agaridevorans]